ncbi:MULTISPECIES: DUF6113 family protein [unclassified Streptomyces]|uniref:DUF6113 family protein n=1 Tax=unclassified Streptomyces TaxID=2593676 RepID=UPI000978E8B0|nr:MULTISPECIES: DUF6113 family protein [unclassified Streptomyces]ONI55464.1 hypothetical protein STIB_10350 [Streptomyces sp. IB2014 011-1]RDV53579.1 hypothetical protein DDV98_01350 [Streptomyces sp. IB2014 011-12]
MSTNPGKGRDRARAPRTDGARAGARGKASGTASSSNAPRTNASPRVPESTGFTARPNPARIAAYFGLAVLGALVALAGTLIQAAWFPGGLIIALAGSAGLFYGGRILTGTQIGALAPAVGWFITVFLLLSGRPEGDYVFGDELGLVLFMLGGTAVAVMCATTSKVPQSATRNGRSGI